MRGRVDRDERQDPVTLMKYGLGAMYWNESVRMAYHGHQAEVILLAGLPDVAESRPHSSAPEF